MAINPKNATPFKNKIHMSLCLLGIIPYLLTAYIFFNLHLALSQSILMITAVILSFHFIGFYILRRFSDELLALVRHSSLFAKQPWKPLQHLVLHKGDTSEVLHIKNNFNGLLTKLEQERQKFNDVTIGLLHESRKDSHEYERRLKAMSPYVDQRLIHQIINNSQHGLDERRGENRRVTVLFVDICGFTQASEKLAPEAVVAMLNSFFDIAVQIIYQHNGIVDKFIGDALMATFGLTTPVYQVSVDAIASGLDLQKAIQDLMNNWEKEGKSTFKVRIGINTGNVIAGDIGSRDRMDYTVIGDTVNVASRLAGHAKPDGVLVSAETYKNCHTYFKANSEGRIKVKNRKKAVEAFSIIEKNEKAFAHHDSFLSTGKIAIEQFIKLR